MPLKKPATPDQPGAVAVAPVTPTDLLTLVQRLPQTHSRSEREAMLLTLIKQADESIAEALASKLGSAPVGLRNEIIDALRDMGGPALQPAARLLHQDDPNLRIYGINILENTWHPALANWMAELIAREPEVNVCAAAIEVLTEVGDSNHVPLLESLRPRFAHSPFINTVIDTAVARLGHHD